MYAYKQMQKENPELELWFFFFTPAFLLPGLKAETNRSKSQLPAKKLYTTSAINTQINLVILMSFVQLAGQGTT